MTRAALILAALLTLVGLAALAHHRPQPWGDYDTERL